MEKLKLPYTIIVEGRYDKLKLESVCEAQILTTEGFGIFKKNEKLALFRKLAEKRPLILLTDSDGAGKLIRSHITSAIPKDRIIQLYTPQIKGKEKRKKEFSAEGNLGVEGMEAALLRDLLKPYESEEAYEGYLENPLSKADFFRDGLMGGEDSAKKRDELSKKLGLPSGMTSNALLATLKIIISYEEYLSLVQREKET